MRKQQRKSKRRKHRSDAPERAAEKPFPATRAITLRNSFKRDAKGYTDEVLDKVKIVVGKIAAGAVLERKYEDHPLHGEHKPARDLHVEPDVLLIYIVNDTHVILVRLGSHSELFDGKALAQAVKAARKMAFLVRPGTKDKQRR